MSKPKRMSHADMLKQLMAQMDSDGKNIAANSGLEKDIGIDLYDSQAGATPEQHDITSVADGGQVGSSQVADEGQVDSSQVADGGQVTDAQRAGK